MAENQNNDLNTISTAASDQAGGVENRRNISIDEINIPDCWHAAQHLRDMQAPAFADQVLACWHIAHDMRDKLQAIRKP